MLNDFSESITGRLYDITSRSDRLRKRPWNAWPRGALTWMGDAAAKLCAFCHSPLDLERELPATAMSNKLLYFSCGSCGAGEWQRASAGSAGRADDDVSSK